MTNVYMMPTPSEAKNDTTNAINQTVLRLQKHLPAAGVNIVEDMRIADLVAGHAGQGSQDIVDVAHCHGLYPTDQFGSTGWHYAANRAVIANLRTAREITVPSSWVGEILARDMHVSPHVIGWALDFENWPIGSPRGYVLWNKTRADSVCTPEPMNRLAALARDVRFVSTFGQAAPNVAVVGRQPYETMKGLVQGASVYLATTKETFGIGTLEAMASGVPILGYRWGSTAELVQHGVTGYLVEPGDIEGLKRGLDYCLEYREALGANGRLIASYYTWETVAQNMARVYQLALKEHIGPLVSVVIPCHNYARFVGDAIMSVLTQRTSFIVEIIVVDDGSTDGSAAVARGKLNLANDYTKVIEQPCLGVATARNRGIAAASGKYIVCLDADDQLGNERFLQELAGALDRDRTLGIAYTGLSFMAEDGTLGDVGAWPGTFDFNEQAAGRNQIPTCCMFKREAWQKTGGYRGRFTPAEDAEFWLRILSIGYTAQQVIPQGWFHYRLHNKSLSSAVRSGQQREPDWTYLHPWTKDHRYPFAAGGKNNMPSHPVRNYDQPKVSVIIPVGPGHLGLLRDALDSVEGQTLREWECIVVLDTQEEPTENLLKAYPWVRWETSLAHDLTSKSKGAGAARNVGVARARAPLVTFLDADDVLEPTFLERTLVEYNIQGGGRYVYTDWYSVNKAGEVEVHETDEYDPNAVFQKPIPHSVNMLMSKAAFQRVGGFDEDMTAWEDVDLIMKLAAAGICGKRVPVALFVYRYQTGARREKGEGDKEKLINLLRERFSEYISGGKMCDCDTIASGRTVLRVEDIPMEDLIEVRYNGPAGGHNLIGAITQTQYGRRQGGDVLFVQKADAEGDPELFTPVPSQVSEALVQTPVPPEPPNLAAQATPRAAQKVSKPVAKTPAKK